MASLLLAVTSEPAASASQAALIAILVSFLCHGIHTLQDVVDVEVDAMAVDSAFTGLFSDTAH